jgi:hypothetical protein
MAPAGLPGLEALRPDSPLGPLRRTWPTWTEARGLADALVGLPTAENKKDLDGARSAKKQWEGFQQNLQSANLPASSALAALVERRLSALTHEIARLQGEAEAAAAAEAVQSAFAAGKYEECLAGSRAWLAKHSGFADVSLTGQIKALGYRAEFQAQREQSRARLKAAASPAEREALLAAFLDRFSGAGPLVESERAVLARCRERLQTLRAEAAADADLRAADEALRTMVADPPAGFDERVARAARIAEKHPTEAVKSALRGRVASWLNEFLPEKQLEEPPELREAETKDGRILRGYFREISGPEGTVGYKRYDTLAQRQNPTADVGTWRADALASAPGTPLPQRLVQRYREARGKLFEQPDRRESWEAFAALCERLQSQCDEYRAKPDAGQEPIGFRVEAAFARRLLAGSALRDFQTIWGTSRE